MQFRLQLKARKSNKRASQSSSHSWIYGLLCLAIIGFFIWIWWNSSPETKRNPSLLSKPITVTNNTAYRENTQSVLLSHKQYKAITNALDDLAQVAKKLQSQAAKTNAAASGSSLFLPILSNNPPVQPALEKPRLAQTNDSLKPRVHSPLEERPAVVFPYGSRPVETILEAQIALARQGIFSGSIDGRLGSQTHSALTTFQNKQHLTPSGALDAQTKSQLLILSPSIAHYIITSNDLDRLTLPAPTWIEKSERPRLDFETLLEFLSEKSFSHPRLIAQLNPGVNWSQVSPGAAVLIPQVSYPPIIDKAAFVKISLQHRRLEAFDSDTNLLVHFPCSIGRLAEKRPVGELRVETIIPNPNYTFDPAVFPESPEAQSVGRKLILPPGPNNPVGVAWIGLNRPGYGIHGTPSPEQVGRTESHGCFRLANWNAEYLSRLVWIGMPVIVEP